MWNQCGFTLFDIDFRGRENFERRGKLRCIARAGYALGVGFVVQIARHFTWCRIDQHDSTLNPLWFHILLRRSA